MLQKDLENVLRMLLLKVLDGKTNIKFRHKLTGVRVGAGVCIHKNKVSVETVITVLDQKTNINLGQQTYSC